MFIYAAFMLFGGTDVLKVTINVFVCSILSFLFVFHVSDFLGSQSFKNLIAVTKFATADDASV